MNEWLLTVALAGGLLGALLKLGTQTVRPEPLLVAVVVVGGALNLYLAGALANAGRSAAGRSCPWRALAGAVVAVIAQACTVPFGRGPVAWDALLITAPLWGAWGGLCFALLVVVTPIMLAMAQEARMYTWAAFFATATSVYAYLAAVGGRRWDFVALAASLFGAAYTHYWALVAAALVSSLVFAWVLVRRRDRAISFGRRWSSPRCCSCPGCVRSPANSTAAW